MKITDISSDIWRDELNEDSGTSIPAIAQFLRTHIGDLNNLLNNGYYINDDFEIVDEHGAEIDEAAISIYKVLYLDYYYNKQSKYYLGANGIDTVVSVQQDGHIVRSTDRNTTAKTYLELKKENKKTLQSLLNNYKFNRSGPKHAQGDDILTKNTPYTVDPTNNATLTS